jgi:hypothetical protein
VGSTDGMSIEEAHTAGFELVRQHSERFVAFVRQLAADPEQLDRSVPGLDWTVGQTITHVQSVYERYTINLERAASHRGVGRQNAEDIERLGVDVETSVASIEAQVATMASLAGAIDPHTLLPFHAQQETTLAGGWGNLLGELLAHGDDLARATGRPFGIPGDDLEILWRYTAPALDGWLRPETAEIEEAWELRFPFATLDIAIARETLRWDRPEPSTSTKRVLTIDDVEKFTLQFPYRRAPITDPSTALLASRFHDI